jgi:hypothetical protein
MEDRLIDPPFKPLTTSNKDTRYVDKEFTRMSKLDKIKF